MDLARMYLSFNNQEESFEFPVLPEEVEIQEKGNNKSHTLQNIGEVTIIDRTKAPIIKVKGLFPKNDGAYVTSKYLLDPEQYIEKIKRWRDTDRPVRLVITGTSIDISWACSVEELSYKEKAGAVGDLEYSITFKEYRWFKVKKLEVVQSGDKKSTTTKAIEERAVEKEIPKTYTVKKGDTLYAICKKQLGDGNKYKEVAKKNNISNPNVIRVGQVLKL